MQNFQLVSRQIQASQVAVPLESVGFDSADLILAQIERHELDDGGEMLGENFCKTASAAWHPLESFVLENLHISFLIEISIEIQLKRFQVFLLPQQLGRVDWVYWIVAEINYRPIVKRFKLDNFDAG